MMDTRTLQSGDTNGTAKDPPEAPATNDTQNGTQKSTIIVIDSEQRWDLGTQTALWATISDLGSFNMEQTSNPNTAVNLMQEGTNRRIIAVIILGAQTTLLSEGIQKVIQESTGKRIKTILLPTDTPQDSEVEAFKQKLQPPRLPKVIQAHNTPEALGRIWEEIREEIRTAVDSSAQIPQVPLT